MKTDTVRNDIYVRPVLVEDAMAINELRRMPGVFENIMGIPSERLLRNQQHLQTLDPNSHMFSAVHVGPDGTEMVIGIASLHVEANPRKRHCGSIGIMVHKDFQGLGVGTMLMEALLDIADNWLKLVRVELTVFADNKRAIHLYEKLGFEKEGVKRKGSIRSGKYEDELMMARIRL